MLNEWETKTWYEVAVWWPREGYGGVTSHATLPEAEAAANALLRLGYKDVHIRCVKTEMVSKVAKA